MTDTEYVLIDEAEGTSESFDDMEELEDFLRDEEYSESDLDRVRVFEVTQEYRVVHNATYDLEKV